MQGRVTSGDVTGASTKTILCLLSSSTRRPAVVQITIGCTDTPADATAVFRVGFITADGTGTARTTVAVNSADGAPSVTAKKNYSGEPTYATNDLEHIGVNQRVTVIYNTPFGGPFTANLSTGANLGIAVQMVSGPALAYNVTLQWDE